MSDRPAIERVLDLAVYAPLGLVLSLRARLPRQVQQGRQALENRVQLARFIGQIAVREGNKAVVKRIEAHRGDELVRSDITASHSPVDPAAAGPETVSSSLAADLPILGYESLAAVHVVERLGSLSDDELDRIHRFEATHRARRTILAKIAQLQAR